MFLNAAVILAFAATITAHTAAWAPGMYCRGGPKIGEDNANTNTVVNPLFELTKTDWWFQHDRGCDAVPPKAGEFLELPANGEFTVELAHNRAQTTLSYEGQFASDWPDGKDHPEDWNGWGTDGTPSVCLKDDGAMHTYNESSAGGTAFAISYHSELKDVTMENLVVFTTLDHTPWKRLATYQVPNLPECPPGGCTCAWLWIPNGCGTANMYMQGFKCKVTGATSTTPVGKAQVPVYCEDNPSKCVSGPKQMLAWHQKDGNNIVTEQWVTPNYNKKCGWADGAQHDIFEGAPTTPSASSSSSSAALSTSTPAGSSVLSARPVSSYVEITSSAVGTPTTLATYVSETASPILSSTDTISYVPIPSAPVSAPVSSEPVYSTPTTSTALSVSMPYSSALSLASTTSTPVSTRRRHQHHHHSPTPLPVSTKKPCTKRQPRASARAAMR